MPDKKMRMKNPKISFLMTAHNEERIIRKALDNLLRIPYGNYETIIGLDGCTDSTEKIVLEYEKKSKKFRHFNLNLRSGKPAVINKIINYAKGEIIIIHDADWIFSVKDKESLERFLGVFKNKKVGGIAESFPIEWSKENLQRSNLGYRIVAHTHNYWFSYQREKLAYKRDGVLFAKAPKMFLTNIFRKGLYRKNVSLGDDFERTKNIMDSGYDIVLFPSAETPRMISSYSKISLPDLIKQKIRTAVARKQLKTSLNSEVGLFSYYLPAILYILRKSFADGILKGLYAATWIGINAFDEIASKFSKLNTKEGWKLRAKRQ